MHLCSDAIRSATDIPFLHIAEATGEAIIKKNFKKVALLGTRFTMEKDFYKTVLRDNYSIEVIVPPTEDRKKIHDIIYNELVHGRIREESRSIYQNIIKDLEKAGAEGVILGCTEIPLLISNDDVDLPVFDTTRIHAEKAVELALKD
jgi:aspartate racemase